MIELIAAYTLSGAPDVFERHDKFPVNREQAAECDSCPCLTPDGDKDCDDVPEPATGALLVLGLGGVWLVAKRKKEMRDG